MTSGPLDEILETERALTAAIEAASEAAAAAIADARRQADQLVEDARARGRAIAERRYAEGLARARDEGDRIRATADERAAGLRSRAEPHMPAAVDLVMDVVLAASGEA